MRLCLVLAAAVLASPAPAAPAGAQAVSGPQSQAASRCRLPEQVELDTPSFVGSGVPAFSRARMEAFRRAATDAFRTAAQAGCGFGELSPERLGAVRRLLIQSGSGATEATFYEDPEGAGPGTLVFQYIFAEADLALPDADDIRLGLACWGDPENEECAGREP
jgi:hypothetical protein